MYAVVAELEGCSPLDLPPLADTSNPDTLDALLADDRGTTEVSFRYCAYAIVATPDEIRVQAPETG